MAGLEAVMAGKEGLKPAQPRLVIEVPESVRTLGTDPKKLVFRLLTLSQELDASRVAGGNNDVKLWEQIKRALAEVDGHVPDAVRAGADSVVEHMSPACRRLVEAAWLRFTYPKGDLDPLLEASTRVEV